MTKEQAYYIAYLRAGPVMHSHRRIAELVASAYPEIIPASLSGNQIAGDHACRAAFLAIYNVSLSEASRQKRWKKIVEAWG